MNEETQADGLAEVIGEHQIFGEYGGALCECGERVGFEWSDLAAHQAAVVLAHLEARGWAQGQEEFGVQFRYGVEWQGRSEEYCRSAIEIHGGAYGFLDAKLVRRRVTPWEPVDGD